MTYFRGTEFAEPMARRSERHASKDYGMGRPILSRRRNNWSARWEAILSVPQATHYAFFLQSDDGSRLFIDDVLVIDHWSDHGWNPGKHGSMPLDQGLHRIRIEHYDRSGAAAVRLKWAGGPIPPNTILGVPYVRKPQEQ